MDAQQKRDPVNHPSHYTTGNQEAIDAIEDVVKFAPSPITGTLQWQALKYLFRMWHKGKPLEDAKKAAWYLNRLIDKLEKGDGILAGQTQSQD
jgi:hypothetical protein